MQNTLYLAEKGALAQIPQVRFGACPQKQSMPDGNIRLLLKILHKNEIITRNYCLVLNLKHSQLNVYDAENVNQNRTQ